MISARGADDRFALAEAHEDELLEGKRLAAAP